MGYPEGGEYEYAPEHYGGGSSFHLESVVPLILIAIVGFLVALNLGWLDNVPGLGEIVGTEPVDVLLIGEPSNATRQVLTGVDAKSLKINTTSPISTENIFKETLANYDVVFLQGTGQQAQFMSLNARLTLADYIDKGGKVVIVQNAATKVKEDASVEGWELGLGDRVPVTCSQSPFQTGSCTTLISIQGQFFPLQQDHEIVKGVKQYPSGSQTTGWTVLDVVSQGEEIAFIKSSTGAFYPAIAQKSNALGGKVVYFNYDPGNTPSVLLNTIQWLR